MQKRIVIAILLYILLVFLTFGVASFIVINDSTKKIVSDQLYIASSVASSLDYVLESNINRLYDISLAGQINFENISTVETKKLLAEAYKYSIFTDGILLVDLNGNLLQAYPSKYYKSANLSSIPAINKALKDDTTTISSLYIFETIKKPVIFVMVSLKNLEGQKIGLVIGLINPVNPQLNQFLQKIAINGESLIQIIDQNEMIIASNKQIVLLQNHDYRGEIGKLIKEKKWGILKCMYNSSNHNVDSSFDLAVIPMKSIPWAIVFGRPSVVITDVINKLIYLFIIVVFIYLIAGFVFSMGLSKGIVKPIKALISEIHLISKGNYDKPVTMVGSDEIFILSKNFEDMRVKLAKTLDRLKNYNIELEKEVIERTNELRESKNRIEMLLKKVINSQENERKRVARELHDGILQDLSAILMRIDILINKKTTNNKNDIEELKLILLKTFDDVKNIMQNLRPIVLDDLGLLSSIEWLIEATLKNRGIEYDFYTEGLDRLRLRPEVEISIFRIIQEALNNIIRHSNAKNVLVSALVKSNLLEIYVEDDGLGFDIRKFLNNVGQFNDDFKGIGLLGMRERATLINGDLEIESKDSIGTKISLKVKLSELLSDV
jgi:two-component system sensor histidine kinase DegS